MHTRFLFLSLGFGRSSRTEEPPGAAQVLHHITVKFHIGFAEEDRLCCGDALPGHCLVSAWDRSCL